MGIKKASFTVALCLAAVNAHAFSLSDIDDLIDQIENEIDDIEEQIDELENDSSLQEEIDQNAQDVLDLADSIRQSALNEISSLESSKDEAVSSLENAMTTYGDKQSYYEQLAEEARRQGQASLETAYSDLAKAWEGLLDKYELELKERYEQILEDISSSETSNVVLIGQSVQFDNVNDSDASTPQLYPNSAIGITSTSEGYIIPLSYTLSNWSKVSMSAPYRSGFHDPLVSLGVFVNDVVFDYFGIRAQALVQDDPRFGYGVEIKERLGSLALLLDYASGQTDYEYDYKNWKYGLGWQFDSTLLYGIYSDLEVTPKSSNSILLSSEYTLGLQRRFTLFGLYQPGINFNLSATAPQDNEMKSNGGNKKLDGEGWRYQVGLTAVF